MQRGMTLQELLSEVQRHETSKRDLVVDGRRALRIAHEDKEAFSLRTGQNGALGMTETAHDQLAGRLNIPGKFYERLRQDHPDMLQDTVNELLEREGKRYMVRTLDDSARAVLSDRYKRLDNGPLLESTLPAIVKGDYETELLGSNVHHDRMDMKVLFTDNRFAQEITVRTRDGSPRVVRPGFRLSNSETGLGSLRLEAFFFDSYCRNGCVFGTEQLFSFRRTHIGTRNGLGELGLLSERTLRAEDAAIMSAVTDCMHKIADPAFVQQLGDKLRAAANTPQADHPMAAVDEAVKALPIRETEKEPILETFLRDGDYSQWGLASAVTSAANSERASWDRACELENIGGKIIDLHPAQWKRIAEAEPIRAAA